MVLINATIPNKAVREHTEREHQCKYYSLKKEESITNTEESRIPLFEWLTKYSCITKNETGCPC